MNQLSLNAIGRAVLNKTVCGGLGPSPVLTEFPVTASQPKSMLWLPGVATPERGLPI
jgi:hypothetical protein